MFREIIKELNMQTNINTEKGFHAVDFMLKTRSQLTESFFTDKQKYLENLKKVMEDFKFQQKKIYS